LDFDNSVTLSIALHYWTPEDFLLGRIGERKDKLLDAQQL